MARLPDPTPGLTGEDRATFDRMLAARRAHGVGLYGPYLTLLHDPPVAERIEALGSYLKFESDLPRPVFQFVVLAVARLTGAAFEWHDHVAHARAAGLPEPVIDTLSRVPAAADPTTLAALGFDEPFEAVAGVLSASMAYTDIGEAAQARAIEQLGERGLVEVVVIGGFYALVSMVNTAFDVPLPDPPAT